MAASHPLRKFREDRRLTQEALGKELGVTGVTVWRWEKGERQIDRSLVANVSAKTGIPARELRPDLAELIEAAE